MALFGVPFLLTKNTQEITPASQKENKGLRKKETVYGNSI